jgi:AraC family transcriptional regulator of adaptative response/methylated-DNA-[protein]-cysteine methyltransferase
MHNKMNDQNEINFRRITRAIEYIIANYREQPGLDKVAAAIGLSPFHFQRLFTEWAGVSPKKFLQYITVEHAKKMLLEHNASLFSTAFETGLSGTGRLHDLFIHIEGMTPGEYKNGGENLTVCYHFAQSPFGNLIVASTPKGICHMAFADDEDAALTELQQRFPRATYVQTTGTVLQNAPNIFSYDVTPAGSTTLHVKGSGFQLKVWEALLKIPVGRLTTYSAIAAQINHPRATRAVGSAVADNPVAWLIPCHRVIRSSGIIGQYHWGTSRKTAMIGWEAARMNYCENPILHQTDSLS